MQGLPRFGIKHSVRDLLLIEITGNVWRQNKPPDK